MRERLFTIGELAKSAGVPTSTVRYYEREGILKPSGRSASNYRLYSEEDLYRLRFIRAAQATGFTLADVTVLLRPAACGDVQERIENRLAHWRMDSGGALARDVSGAPAEWPLSSRRYAERLGPRSAR